MGNMKSSAVSVARSASPHVPRASKHEPLFSIGDLAKEFGVTLRTLRFYEDRGLLTPLRDGQARFYRAQDKARLALILKVKAFGFTLGEIRDLILSRGSDDTGSLPLNSAQISSQIDHLKRQRDAIDQAIEQLSAVRDRLAKAT